MHNHTVLIWGGVLGLACGGLLAEELVEDKGDVVIIRSLDMNGLDQTAVMPRKLWDIKVETAQNPSTAGTTVHPDDNRQFLGWNEDDLAEFQVTTHDGRHFKELLPRRVYDMLDLG